VASASFISNICWKHVTSAFFPKEEEENEENYPVIAPRHYHAGPRRMYTSRGRMGGYGCR
jgi:hypothetical protein